MRNFYKTLSFVAILSCQSYANPLTCYEQARKKPDSYRSPTAQDGLAMEEKNAAILCRGAGSALPAALNCYEQARKKPDSYGNPTAQDGLAMEEKNAAFLCQGVTDIGEMYKVLNCYEKARKQPGRYRDPSEQDGLAMEEDNSAMLCSLGRN